LTITTCIFEYDSERVKMNQRAKYIGHFTDT